MHMHMHNYALSINTTQVTRLGIHFRPLKMANSTPGQRPERSSLSSLVQSTFSLIGQIETVQQPVPKAISPSEVAMESHPTGDSTMLHFHTKEGAGSVSNEQVAKQGPLDKTSRAGNGAPVWLTGRQASLPQVSVSSLTTPEG